MVARPTGRHAKIRKDMATAGESSTGQRALEDSCGWPMPLEGATGVRRRRKSHCISHMVLHDRKYTISS